MARTELRAVQLKKLVVGAVSVLLVGSAAAPAYAESVRSQQWHLDAMQADEMWKVSRGEGVTVAVIDSGVDSSLPDLEGQVLKGKDFAPDRRGDAHVDYGNHGTSMATLIAATGKAGAEKGSYGLAPASKILPLRVDEDRKAGNQAEVEASFGKRIGPAIRFAADSEAKIINISLASEGNPPELKSAVNYALKKGKLIFAGVGNDGEKGNPVMYPAATPGVIGVSAVNKKVAATDESEHGPQVDLAAPGDEMVAACTGGTKLCKSHGTSDATALASASAALIWSKHPNWTANQVTRVLVNTAGKPESGKKRSDFIGYGAVRPRIALKNPGDPGDPKTNPLPGPYNEADAKKKADAQDKGDFVAPADDGTSTGAYIGYGLAAAAVLGAAVATPLIIRRRRAAVPTVTRGYPQPPAQTWPNTPPPPQHHPNDQRQY
ncbi:type VII secretion-associated serine protease mycosin [Streptomyces albidus (ex Kaewkla and Franco 2022)]|uniref:type VII secretion-associated serine protease mycosin n=1 Tax=Streptomyces albidus (ex Kaewkla and Franco 2022) TaxID=722709 RepID=UPI0015EEF375|nr:type VII secretion-associated serine protease mycosin [Streptomyces albidus (ex Kaewkla and Franco 2022)]